YIRSLLRGLFEGPPANPELRAEYAAVMEREGGAALHGMLAKVDGATAKRLHGNDVLRVTRALEVYRLTGEPLSAHLDRHRLAEQRYDATLVCVTRERPLLHERINQRCVTMLESGLAAETHALVEAGASWAAPGFAALGYRHIADVARGTLPEADLLRTFQTDTRRFAKRQGTFFRGQLNADWVSVDDEAFDTDAWCVRTLKDLGGAD
ncbi:MAG: tRNA dimethylallyltransferase, partial [Bradymonadia bacterium]